MSIKLVLLDLGGVFFKLDWSQSLSKGGFRTSSQQREVLDFIKDWELSHDFEKGLISEEFYLDSLARYLGLNNFIESKTLWNEIISYQFEGAEKILEACLHSYRVCALSNTNYTHMTYIMNNYPIMERFHQIYTSYDFQARKPEKEIYLKALEKENCNPEDCLFIDDSSENIEIAKELGIRAFQSVDSVEKTLDLLNEHLD